MTSKMSMGDLGWKVESDDCRVVTFRRGDAELRVDLTKRKVVIGEEELTFATLAAILDFVMEDAIY